MGKSMDDMARISQSDEKRFRIQTAAELTGLTVEVIRAWERRYGLFEPQRTPGGFRLYSEVDIALLRRIRSLLDNGMAIGEAARLAPALRQEVRFQREAAAEPPLAAWRERMLAAAATLDHRAIEQAMDEVLSALHPLEALERVLVPAQQEMGARWAEGRATIVEEHLLTHSVRERMLSLLHGAPVGQGPHVVLAGFPDEQHELGLLAIALHCRYMGFRVTVLGAQTPAEELARAVERLKPQGVGLSSVYDQGEERFRETLGRIMAACPKGVPIMVGGPAARTHAAVCRELGAAVQLVDEDVGSLIATRARTGRARKTGRARPGR